MKTRRFFQKICILLFLLSGAVFGQYPDPTGPRGARLSIGNDWANPVLDPFLMEHVIYARDTLSIHSHSGTPNSGIVGTDVFTNTGAASGGARLTLQSGIAHIGTNRGNLARGTTNPDTNRVYFGGVGNPIAGGNATNIIQPRIPVYENDVFPRLPDIPVSSRPRNQSEAAALGIEHWHGSSVTVGNTTWQAGVRFINGDLTLNDNARLTIAPRPGTTDYRTIIYVTGRVFLRTGASFVPQGFVSINDYPAEARGQILLIALSNHCDDCMGLSMGQRGAAAAIHTVWGTGAIIGSFIAPYGTIYMQYRSPVSGQVLAQRIRFVGQVGPDGFVFEPGQFTNLTAATTGGPFTREWRCDANRTTPVQTFNIGLNNALTGNQSITLRYTITLEGGLQNPRDVRNFSPSALTGNLTFNASNQTHPITFQLVNDESAAQGGSIRVVLDTLANWHSGFDGTVNLTLDNPGIITINPATAQTRPARPSISGSQNSIIEHHTNLAGTRRNPVGQVVATLNAPPSGAQLLFANGTSIYNGFTINSSRQIITNGYYRANYDTGDRTIPLQIIVRHDRGTQLACIQDSDPLSITVAILPWNNRAFETQPITATINAGSTLQIHPTGGTYNWFISDADAPNVNNRQIVRAVVASASTTQRDGIWNAGNPAIPAQSVLAGPTPATSSNTSLTIPNGGGTVAIANNIVIYTPPATPLTAPVSFFIVARDTAAYTDALTGASWNTDHFDRWIPVSVVVNSPPILEPLTRNVCKYDELAVNISELGLTGAHTFVAPHTASPNIGAFRIENSGQRLVYDLRGLTPAENRSPITITYTVRNTATTLTGEGTITVAIDPARDQRPTGIDTVITGITVGATRDINLANRWTNHNFGNDRNALAILDHSNLPDGITVEVVPPATFRIIVPRDFTLADNVYYFTYRIVDNISPLCPNPTGQVPSEPIEVRFVLERGTVGAAQPVRDRIILDRQGGNRTVSTLWDGETNILANDAPTIDDPAVFAATVIMGDSTSRGELLLRADGTFTYTADVGLVNNQLRQPEDNFTYYSLTSPTDGEVRSDFPAFVDIFVNWYNDSTPKLTAKTDQLRAREGRVIPIITAADTDDDWGTILRINRNVPFTFTVNGVSTPASDPRFADVEIRGDSTIFFRYSADIAAPTTVVLTFHVNDDVNYMHYFNNNGVFDSIPYNFAHSTSNTLTLTIAPNPAAVDFEMQVREREHTSDIHYPTIGGEIYANILAALRDIWGDTWIESGVSFTLADSTQHGILTHNLTGAGSNGTVRYDHVNTAELTDRFVYTLAITLPDGTRISSDGTVVVRVMSREPFVMNDGFYEDRNADGTIDFVVIPFDRDVDLVNTTFGIVFEYGGETLTVQHDGGRFVRENDVPNRSLIEISLNNMPPNITDGSMTITITPPDNIWGAQQQVVRPRDAAAPVITSAMFTRSLFSNDTLVLTFSEPTTSISTGGGSLPFKFITEAGEEYTISFAERIPADNNREWTFIITMADGGIIVGGDSVFINYDNIIDEQNAVITDMAENSQTNPHNVRVPIERQTRTQILSATYWDDFGVLSNGRTSDALDGFIDRISIDLGMQVESSFAQRIAQALILPASRGFTKGDITLTETGFDLAVIEANAVWRDGRRTGEPRTSVGSDEVIGITEIADGSITVEASGITPFDRVAPVILRAYYVFSPDNPDTTLEVVFSEPVELIGRANTLPDSPYSFYSRNLVRNYNMIFVNSDPIRSADNIRWTYNVASSSIPYPLSGDSLWIMQGGHVFDADGNEAELTVRAPLILSDEYADNFELWVVPQPLRLVNVRGRTEPAVLDEGLARYYQIPIGTQGVALIVEAMGPVHPNHYNNRGTMRIINNVGNVVRENVEMRFVVIQDGDRAGNVVGVAVWDGKNDAGRFVGAATYLALIDVSVQFYDRPSPVRREFRRQISVSSAGTSAGD